MSIHVKAIHTPWGLADHEKTYADGIVFYGTPSHGGLKLDAERNAKVHPALREQDGWYEEDCAWAKVAFTFPEAFPETEREVVVQTLKNWFPDEYEAVTGTVLALGESRIKDERYFLREHADDWIVISAINSDRHPGMVECVATKGGDCNGGVARRYLVAEGEYDKRGSFGFVIDEARHMPYDGPSSFATFRAYSAHHVQAGG
ncbi:MAG: hypothetical protein PHW76_02750 [Alphaproteobacteria bacterium]|nr:hypothetical protein [Alphaproteobacteria bacterium]